MSLPEISPAAARRLATLVFVVACGAACLIYLRGIHGPYVLDDYANLVLNDDVHIKSLDFNSLESAALSSPSGVFRRPLAMLSFAANYLASGSPGPASLKLTNVVLHLATGIGVYLLCLVILPFLLPPASGPPWMPRAIAAFTAAFWILHPLFVSTVLYAVQRMTILSALVTVYTCAGYVSLRRRSLETNRGYVLMPASVAVTTVIATLCKENGALLPTYLLVLEYFCFRFQLHQGAPAWVRRWFKPALVAPTLLVVGFLLLQFIYGGRAAPGSSFTVAQRLITEARALWQYVGWLAFLNPAPLGLVHGDFHASTSLVSPVTTLLSVAAWVAVAAACIAYRADPRYRLYVFGCAWFLGGQLLESTTIPLSLMFEHRNYLPGFGILLGIAAAGRYFVAGSRRRRAAGLAMLGYAFLALPAWLLYQRVDQWHSEGSLTASLLRVEPRSGWTWIQLAQFYNHQGDFKKALEAIQHARHLEPDKQSHIFNEAALRCHFQPGEQLPGQLSHQITLLDLDHPTSRAALWAFKNFAQTCAQSRSNRYFTRMVLDQVSIKDHGHVAALAREWLMALYGATGGNSDDTGSPSPER